MWLRPLVIWNKSLGDEPACAVRKDQVRNRHPIDQFCDAVVYVSPAQLRANERLVKWVSRMSHLFLVWLAGNLTGSCAHRRNNSLYPRRVSP
jgi:hypothetical protein